MGVNSLSERTSLRDKVIEKSFAGLAVIQFLALCYFNLFLLKQHMGGDAASVFHNAIEMWNQRTLILSDWQYPTTLNIDTPAPLAALLYGMIGDIFISYGIANIIFIILLIIVFWKFMGLFDISYLGKMVALNFLICPHLMIYDLNNSLSYGSMLLYDGGWYSTKLLESLLVLWTAAKFYRGETKKSLIVFSILGAMMCGASSGYWLLGTVICPLLLWLVVEELWQGRSMGDTFKTNACRYVLGLGFLSIAVKFVTGKLFHVTTLDASMLLVTLPKLWSNLQALLIGYLDVQSALPMIGAVKIFSNHGLLYMVYFSFAMLMLLAVVSRLRKEWLDRADPNWRMLLFFIAGNLLILALLETNYSEGIAESRYYIYIYAIGLIFLGDFLGKIFAREKSFLVVCLLLLLFIDITSSRNYARAKNNVYELSMLAAELDKYAEEKVVCLFGEELIIDYHRLSAYDKNKIYKNVARYNDEMRKWEDKLRVWGMDENRMYKKVWGDYAIAQVANSTKGNEVIEQAGDMLIVAKEERLGDLPAEIRSRAELVHSDFYGYVIMKYTAASQR